jgi:hypothetical protein
MVGVDLPAVHELMGSDHLGTCLLNNPHFENLLVFIKDFPYYMVSVSPDSGYRQKMAHDNTSTRVMDQGQQTGHYTILKPLGKG